LTIKVLVVDDQALVRAGIRMLLDTQDDLEVIGEAADGAEAVALADRLRPDVVLMDIRMPGLDGIEAARRIIAFGPDPPRVVMLTTFDLDEYVFDALAAGASGFLLKHALPEEVLFGVRAAAAGDALVSPALTRRLIEHFALNRPRAAPELDRLTVREHEILSLMILGRSNVEIATELAVGESTVKTHVARVLTKLKLRDRAQAVIYGYETGLVTPGGRPPPAGSADRCRDRFVVNPRPETQ
jgi:DNA-binding NarL/FixJ family response regulator